MNVKKIKMPTEKYDLKCPYECERKFIIVHNTFNDATAQNEVKYMSKNELRTSFHYAIDDKEIVQAIEENRNSFNAGDGEYGLGNTYGLAIEICYSHSGGNRFLEAEKLASKFIAFKLKQYGWGIDKVTKHQDYSGKYCPHRTLDMGWERFLNMVQSEIDQLNGEAWKNKIINCETISRPKEWINAIEKVTEFAKKNDIGELNILEYLPDLIEEL